MKTYHLDDSEIFLKFTHPVFMIETVDNYYVSIESTYILNVDGRQHSIHPNTPANELQETAIDAFCEEGLRLIEISDDSRLTLTTALGSTISVDPNPDFDSWSINDPGGLKIVCLHGGEIGIWGPPEDRLSTDANSTGSQ